MVLEIWFYKNEKTRKKANFENHEKTVKKHELPEEYKLYANEIKCVLMER